MNRVYLVHGSKTGVLTSHSRAIVEGEHKSDPRQLCAVGKLQYLRPRYTSH